MAKAKIFESLPSEAVKIRTTVFVDEQGFEEEFDSVDDSAWHIILFEDNKAVATCRVFFDEKLKSYILGRLAVIKEYRGRSLGSQTVKEAEKLVISKSGKSIMLHSQYRACEFYEKQGYKKHGEPDYEQDCKHIWMKKEF